MRTAILKYVLGAGVSCALAFAFVIRQMPSRRCQTPQRLSHQCRVWSPMHDIIVVATAMADATMVMAMDMAELQPVRLSAVRFSAGCSLRLTIMGAAHITIQTPATTHTGLPQGVQWLTACNGSDRMILVAAHT